MPFSFKSEKALKASVGMGMGSPPLGVSQRKRHFFRATSLEVLNLKVLGDPGLEFDRDLIRAGPFAVKDHRSIQDQSNIIVMLKEQGVRP